MKNLAVIEALESAAAVIQGGFWCQGKLAKNYFGMPVDTGDPSACYWCVSGAIGEFDQRLLCKFAFISETIGVDNTPTWNDAPGQTAEKVAAKLWEISAKMRGEWLG